MNTKKMFGIDNIGVLEGDRFRASFMGLAIKNNDGAYVCYDKVTNTITNVGDMVFEGIDTVMAIPTPTVVPGDLILRGDEPMYIKMASDNDSFIIVNPLNDREEVYLPQKMLFGFRIFVKVISMFGGMTPQGDINSANQLQNMMLPMMAMGAFGKGAGAGGEKSGIDPMMMMMMSGMGGSMFGGAPAAGGAAPAGGLFGGAAGGMNPMMMMMMMGGLGGKGGKSGGIDPMMLMMMSGGFGGAGGGAAGANPFAAMFGGAVPTTNTDSE